MNPALKAIIALALALAFAIPVSGGSRLRPARFGELVIVTLRDGTQMNGDVGTWVGAQAFSVKPPDSSASLIKVSDVLTIRAASNGESLDLPDRHQSKKWVVVVAAIAVGILLGVAAGHGQARS